MSATGSRDRPAAAGLDAFPQFELAYLYDDDDEPSEVTVFPSRFDDDLATNWITMDVGHTVPLDRVR